MKLSEAVKLLDACGIDSAKHDAAVLFEVFGGFQKSELHLGDPDSCEKKLIDAIERRSHREPLQYIVGEAWFYRESYKVTPDCLIPRSDTEILVDYAVKHIPAGERFADLCTGSGCIAISVLKNTDATEALAVDISEAALAIAKKNSIRNGTEERLTLLCADVLSLDIGGELFAVLSNPPYVTEQAYKNLQSEVYHEPKLALVGLDNGLLFYKSITKRYKDKIKPEGFILFEIGYDQADALREIAKNEGLSVEIIKDFSGNDRVAVLKKQ